jgi:hypothetical protein
VGGEGGMGMGTVGLALWRWFLYAPDVMSVPLVPGEKPCGHLALVGRCVPTQGA